MCSLGCCYEQGDGVARAPAEAVRWYSAAAAQGYALAQCNLGDCHAFGLGGLTPDAAKARALYRKAAAQGLAAAKEALAKLDEPAAAK